MYKYQFGFRKGCSTEQAILELTDTLKKAMDKNLVACGPFLDFSKAFDTVNHTILLSKLYHYGIRGISFKWLENYLSNRTQFVKIGNTKSITESRPLKSVAREMWGTHDVSQAQLPGNEVAKAHRQLRSLKI